MQSALAFWQVRSRNRRPDVVRATMAVGGGLTSSAMHGEGGCVSDRGATFMGLGKGKDLAQA